MEIEKMNMEQVEARCAEIKTMLDGDGEIDVRALSEELDQLDARKKAIEAEAEEKRAAKEKVAGMTVPPVAVIEVKEKNEMEIEMRNTPAYIEAYANYIKTGNDAECRALLTENASGDVQVPDLVYDEIKAAWDRDGIMALVKKSYMKGNLRVAFEISGDDANIHTEGVAVNEENLVMGVVELKPVAIKKWISISDEAIDLTGEKYLRYIYAELTYRIAKKAGETVIAKIEACDTVSTDTQVAVPVVTAATIAVSTIAKAMAQLSAEASNPVIVMNRATWGDFKDVQYSNKYGVDPFEGLRVVFHNNLPAFDAATTGDTYAIVGDFGEGALANFPAGDGITIKRDDLTLATSDLVRFIGREFVGVGIVAPKAFVKVQK